MDYKFFITAFIMAMLTVIVLYQVVLPQLDDAIYGINIHNAAANVSPTHNMTTANYSLSGVTQTLLIVAFLVAIAFGIVMTVL